MKINSIAVLMMVCATFISCASNKQVPPSGENESTFTPNTPIPVGSAHVSLKLVGVDDNTVIATVNEVMGYGSSTERITSETSLELSINSAMAESFEQMAIGDTFKAEISKTPPAMNGEGSGWRIIKLLD